MPGLPADLRPINTQPWSERPGNLPLDREEVRTALWVNDGNVTRAAVDLKVTSTRLRQFINGSAYLRREIEEMQDRMLDTAEDILREDLSNPDTKSSASRFVIDKLGHRRGWGKGPAVNVNNTKGGTVVLQWADGSSIALDDDSKTIDGEVVNG